jgi:hypothetical protein
MVNIRSLIDGAIQLAHMGGEILPPLKGGAVIADQLVDLLDGLKAVAPNQDAKADLEAAHVALLKRVSDKGHATSARLRGQ